MKKPLEAVKAWTEAHNSHNLSRLNDLYGENITFELAGMMEAEGKQGAREVAEFDRATKSQRTLNELRLEGDTVYCDLTEKNEWLRTAGIREAHYSGAFTVREGQIEAIRFEPKPETKQATEEALSSFTQWASEEKPEHLAEIMPEGKITYDAKSAKKWLPLMQEWRDTTKTT